MIDLPSIFIANGLGAALMLILIFSNRRKVRTVFLDEKLFLTMCILDLLMCLLETLTFVIDGRAFPGARGLILVSNAALFATNSLFSFSWVLYADYKLFGRLDRLRRIYPLVSLPAAAVVLLSVANLFTDVFFTVSADNVYSRTGLVYLTYLVTYGYLICGAVLVFRYRKKVGKYLFMPVVVFLAPVFLGSLLQMCFYGISLIWVSVAFGLTSLYINLQNELSLVDSLTKLYNRDYLTRYLNYTVQRIPPEQWLAGIMMDINSFKSINDTYGHSEGDAVLREVGRMLLSAVPREDLAARYGGDEFIVLSSVRGEKDLHTLMDAIHRRADQINAAGRHPYPISLSMGATLYLPGEDTMDSFLRRMDQRMYEAKRAHYSSGANDRRQNCRRRDDPADQPLREAESDDSAPAGIAAPSSPGQI